MAEPRTVPSCRFHTCCGCRSIRPIVNLRLSRLLVLLVAALMGTGLLCLIWNNEMSSTDTQSTSPATSQICSGNSVKKEPKSWCLLSNTHLEKMLKLKGPSKTEVMNASSCKTHKVALATVADVEVDKVMFYSLEEVKTIAENLTKADLSPFYPLLSKDMKVMLLTLYLVMSRALDMAGIPFMVTAGSLLGHYRTSGILPWDDDLDVIINVSRWRDVMQALNCIEGYELGLQAHQRWAIYPVNGTPTAGHVQKKLPFIDIFFFQEDATHIIILHWLTPLRSIFPKAIAFPLKTIVLEGIAMPGPRDLLAYLTLAYSDLTLCSSQTYVHSKIVPNYSVTTVPCTDLFPLYGEFRLPPSKNPTHS